MITIELTAAYLPTFLACVFILTAFRLWVAGAVETKRYMAGLMALFAISHVPSIWLDASLLMWYEVLIFFPMWFGLKSRHGRALSILTVCMIINNGYFEIAGGWPLHRLSVVSLLFFAQCVIGIHLSYDPHYKSEKKKGSSNGSILAHVQALVGYRKAGRKT